MSEHQTASSQIQWIGQLRPSGSQAEFQNGLVRAVVLCTLGSLQKLINIILLKYWSFAMNALQCFVTVVHRHVKSRIPSRGIRDFSSPESRGILATGFSGFSGLI